MGWFTRKGKEQQQLREPLIDPERGETPQGGSAAQRQQGQGQHHQQQEHGRVGASSAATGGQGAGRPRQRKNGWVKLVGTSFSYVWPKTFSQQLRVVLCALILVVVRVLNLAVPIVYKHVVDAVSRVSSATHPPPGQEPKTFTFMDVFYPWIALYLLLMFFQGGAGSGTVGLLSNMRSYLWVPVSQAAYRRISLLLFGHVLDLDLQFHLHRKTGEVMRVMDRGTSAIQNLLSVFLFQIGPQMFDIVAASVYLATALEPWVAVILFITLIGYIPITAILTEWRGRFRRDLNAADNRKSARVTDCLLNYETVKYFNNEPLERDNFAEAIDGYQAVEFKLLASLNFLNVVQSFIIFGGTSAGLLVCTRGVAAGRLTVGDLVLFLTLMAQLCAPLNYLGTYYRTLQQYGIDMENMFDLLKQNPQVEDAPGAKDLVAGTKPRVSFNKVCFKYAPEHQPVLRDVSWEAAGGSTVALVGATGSGKTTCLRLLYRFYDPTEGVVEIEGQALTGVTQASLRAAIGIVPQDVVLFNDTVAYNIRYGRPSATDEEVYDAARAASIHDIIESKFPKGYDTIVGERGLRLSGGEKQRVAIARAVLKNAPILMLDEATSALDSITEKDIQDAITALRSTRTTIIIAHRLSTIRDADLIVVLKDGQVAESGSHTQLTGQGGIYASMWQRQGEAADFDRPGTADGGTMSKAGSSAAIAEDAG